VFFLRAGCSFWRAGCFSLKALHEILRRNILQLFFYQSNNTFLSSINLAILVIKNLDLDTDPDPDRNSTNVDPENLLRSLLSINRFSLLSNESDWEKLHNNIHFVTTLPGPSLLSFPLSLFCSQVATCLFASALAAMRPSVFAAFFPNVPYTVYTVHSYLTPLGGRDF
jgi:hypothetical protein